MPDLRVVVAGAGGRMGRALTRAVLTEPKMRVVAALDRPDTEAQGKDAGLIAGVGPCGILITSDPLPAFANADVILDFTAPAATLAYAELSAQARVVHVIGTTGITPEDDKLLKAAARHCRIVRSGNMSLGVNVLAALVKRAAATLGPDYDIEVVEMHHRHKVDAPSGTALELGEIVARALRKKDFVFGRKGIIGERQPKQIGFHSIRGGDIVGEHTVVFAGPGERVEVTVRSQSRMTYALGALRAAKFLKGREPGLYGMGDVLGL